jgi:transmembrane protein TMEM220
MSVLRIASGVMALLFFVCVGLQYNDPDPVQWMAIYGAAAFVSVMHAWRGQVPVAFPLVVAVAAVAWGVYIASHIHGRFEWHHLAESMHAGTPQIEESRETLGLLIVAAWMIVVAFAGGARAPSRVVSAPPVETTAHR